MYPFANYRYAPAVYAGLALLACMSSDVVGAGKSPTAHVHGSAALNVTVEGSTLLLELDSPVENLLGFEHPPRDARERRAVAAMAAKLQQPGTLFVSTAAAQCAAGRVTLNSPVLDNSAPRKGGGADAGHTDLRADFTFQCAAPQALRELKIDLFDAFPGIRKLNVQLLTPRGQAAATLTSRSRRLAW